MFRLILFLSLFLLTDAGICQSASAVLFSENGELFKAELNEISLNNIPVANLKISGLNEEYYTLTLTFSGSAPQNLTTTLAVSPGNQIVYSVRKNNNGEYVLRLMDADNMNSVMQNGSTQYTVDYSLLHKPVTGSATQKITTASPVFQPEADIETISLSVTETGCETLPVSAAVAPVTSTPVAMHYTGSKGCDIPLTDDDFRDIKKLIYDEINEKEKVRIAQKIVAQNCFYANQVKEICELVSFEDSRLDLAKYSYAHTYDQDNYQVVNAVFNFETSVEELNNYVRSFK